MEIKYDTPFEVNKKQYEALSKGEWAGTLCHRIEDGKYYIKIWLMRYAKEIKKVIEDNK